MIDLFTMFTIPQLCIGIIMLILAIKGAWDLVDFFKTKYKEKFNKDHSRIAKEEELERHYQECKNQHIETLSLYEKLENKIDILSDTVTYQFKDLNDKINILTESDMHDIKQSIVKDYHYFVEEQGWIDDFNLDTILLRYSDYKKEDGNSYIEMLIDEIKKLPKHPSK